MYCTFFGHRDINNDITALLRNTITDLIVKQGITNFYVGNQGDFDNTVRKVLSDLKSEFAEIEFTLVLAYMPKNITSKYETIYPEGLETKPRKFAIYYRNKWMVENSDYVITYVTHGFGGAAQFKELAEKQGKTVINIADF